MDANNSAGNNNTNNNDENTLASTVSAGGPGNGNATPAANVHIVVTDTTTSGVSGAGNEAVASNVQGGHLAHHSHGGDQSGSSDGTESDGAAADGETEQELYASVSNTQQTWLRAIALRDPCKADPLPGEENGVPLDTPQCFVIYTGTFPMATSDYVKRKKKRAKSQANHIHPAWNVHHSLQTKDPDEAQETRENLEFVPETVLEDYCLSDPRVRVHLWANDRVHTIKKTVSRHESDRTQTISPLLADPKMLLDQLTANSLPKESKELLDAQVHVRNAALMFCWAMRSYRDKERALRYAAGRRYRPIASGEYHNVAADRPRKPVKPILDPLSAGPDYSKPVEDEYDGFETPPPRKAPLKDKGKERVYHDLPPVHDVQDDGQWVYSPTDQDDEDEEESIATLLADYAKAREQGNALYLPRQMLGTDKPRTTTTGTSDTNAGGNGMDKGMPPRMPVRCAHSHAACSGDQIRCARYSGAPRTRRCTGSPPPSCLRASPGRACTASWPSGTPSGPRAIGWAAIATTAMTMAPMMMTVTMSVEATLGWLLAPLPTSLLLPLSAYRLCQTTRLALRERRALSPSRAPWTNRTGRGSACRKATRAIATRSADRAIPTTSPCLMRRGSR
jgi:hypothetical protein